MNIDTKQVNHVFTTRGIYIFMSLTEFTNVKSQSNNSGELEFR